VEDLAIVVEADPRLRCQAVPRVKREPDRVPERGENERGVDRERREQIEVADPARRARRVDPLAAATPPKPCRPPQRKCRGGRLGALLGEAQLLWNFE
jgi:hypothetical protein